MQAVHTLKRVVIRLRSFGTGLDLHLFPGCLVPDVGLGDYKDRSDEKRLFKSVGANLVFAL